MSHGEPIPRASGCSEPLVSGYLVDYCFADLPDEQRRLFEAHLLECEHCWREVRRLGAAVEVLRQDKSLVWSAAQADLSAPGISEKLERPFGGHMGHVLVTCAIYALAYVVALLVEVVYVLDKLGPTLLRIAPAVFLWIFATSTAALYVDWKSVVAGRRNGLALSLTVLASAAVVLYAALFLLFLPDSPVTPMKIQAHTPQASFLKSVRHFIPTAGFFLALPFHFVLAMQRELREGRWREVLGLLCGEKWATAPPGTFFLTLRTFWILLLIALLASIALLNYQFWNLQAGPYMNLFIHLVQAKWVIFFSIGLKCLAWYSKRLDDLKLESLPAAYTLP
jgi:hypothetical protein